MTRPVRPVALVILTVCMIYPGLTSVYQGLYPLWAGEFFNLVGQKGVLMDLAVKMKIPVALVLGMKAAIGFAWLAGVPGIWAGDWKAYGLTLLAAAGSLLLPGGPMFMGALGLICLIFFRENAETVAA